MRPSERWLKPIGSSDHRLDPNWLTVRPRELKWVDFADQGRPSVAVDDHLLYYATGYGCLYGIVKVFSKPELKPEGGRWPWKAEVRPGLIIADLDRCPPLSVASVGERSLQNAISMGAGHVRLKETEWEAALAALRAACAPENGDLLDEYYLP
jgi:hypothetical protein